MRKSLQAVRAKLSNLVSYSFCRYRLRHQAGCQEELTLNDELSGYPRNHNYELRNGTLVPSFRLFERFSRVSNLFSPDMHSFLDIGSCRGFYVINAALRSSCQRAVGIDVYNPFVDLAQRVVEVLRLPNCNFHLATLDELIADPPKFGGPFHTVLNIGTYHYLFWGSKICAKGYFDHREILSRFAQLCTHQVIVSARFELDRLPELVKPTAADHTQRSHYSQEAFLEAADEFFDVQHKGSLGTYPLLLLTKRDAA